MSEFARFTWQAGIPRMCTNVKTVRFTCCYGSILRREMHTLSVDVGPHSINQQLFDGGPVNVSMCLSNQVIGTILCLRLSNQVIVTKLLDFGSPKRGTPSAVERQRVVVF